MSVFIDTGVWFAHHDRDATRHPQATAAFESLLDGSRGRLYTSDYVYDEAVTLTRGRTGSFEDARRVGERIRGDGEFSAAAELLYVSDGAFARSIDVFERYRDHPLSFTDATTVALVDEHDVDYLLSFDDDFDGIVDRLDPGDL